MDPFSLIQPWVVPLPHFQFEIMYRTIVLLLISHVDVLTNRPFKITLESPIEDKCQAFQAFITTFFTIVSGV